MNGATWLPSLVVLATGLGLGLLLAYRLRQASSASRAPESADLQLKIRDLEARRDDLYRRLRSADEDRLTAAEISALEESAARVLFQLNQLDRGRLEQASGTGDRSSETPSSSTVRSQSEARPPSPAHRRERSPLITGLAFAAGMVLVVAVLVYWAVRDAQPENQTGGSTATVRTGDRPHEGQAQVPAELARQIADLDSRVAANPDDWQSRKQLASSLLAAGDFFEAFNQASQILQRLPEDPDGLFVHGVVRLTMGQSNQALELMDRVLAQHPDHKQALVYRGLALYQMGNVEQAQDTWETGLEMVGGRDPEFEELLAMARSGTEPAGPGVGSPNGSGNPQVATPSRVGSEEGFALEVDLASGLLVPPGATLFVFLRTEDGGPPVAARRVVAPSFPAQITLTAADSMMGAELPESGTIVVRLDSDGTASTTSAEDLGVEAPATKGQTTRLTLGS